jgi:hypothetical protein
MEIWEFRFSNIKLSTFFFKKMKENKVWSNGRAVSIHLAEPEPVFLNVYGAPELIPRNGFHQPM